jgi:hypothetical protein
MFMVGNARNNPTGGLGLPWLPKVPALRKSDLLAGVLCQPSTFNSGCQFEKNSFLTERSLNVIENKGPLWKTWGRSLNVYENKYTYPFNPGMLLKTQGVKSRHQKRNPQ